MTEQESKDWDRKERASFNRAMKGIVINMRRGDEVEDWPLYSLGPVNLLCGIEFIQQRYRPENPELWKNKNHWLTVAGVEIHTGSIKNKADAKLVIEQILAGTYVKPELELSLSPIEYQGVSMFWNDNFRVTLGDKENKLFRQFRKMIRKEFIAQGLPLNGDTPRHWAIISRLEDKLQIEYY